MEIRTLELLIIEDLDPLPTADHHPTSPGPTPTQCPKSRLTLGRLGALTAARSGRPVSDLRTGRGSQQISSRPLLDPMRTRTNPINAMAPPSVFRNLFDHRGRHSVWYSGISRTADMELRFLSNFRGLSRLAVLGLSMAALIMGGVAAPAAASGMAAPAAESHISATSNSAPTLPAATLPASSLESPYSYRFTWTGDLIMASTKLPAGMTLSRDGLLSGTPTIEGVHTFMLSASTHSGEADEWPERVSRQFTLSVVGNVHLETRHVSLPNMAREVVTMTCPATHPGVRNIPGNVMAGLNAVYEDTESTAFLRLRHLVNYHGQAYGVEVTIKNADGLGRHLWTDLTLHCTNKTTETITP